jgi:hypothetical protein
MRTYVRVVGLAWRQRSMTRWHGTEEEGRQVGHVGLKVTGGGAERSWHGWRRGGTPEGIDVGNFSTAEAAIAAVDAAE